MNRDTWDPIQYERFRDERAQPFFDLLATVRPRPGMRILDVGCGTGELTRVLHERLQAAETIGIDSSRKMLERSADHARGGVRFEQADMRELTARAEFDLIFSNAALQWVSEHEAILARLSDGLRAGGQLAIQMPANHDHPSHTVAADVAREKPFCDALPGGERHSPVLEPERYARALDRLGYREQDVCLHVYGHHLQSREEVVEWVKGTLLTDYERRLPPGLYDSFLARYRERLLSLLEDAHPYFFTFKRVLIWGAR